MISEHNPLLTFKVTELEFKPNWDIDAALELSYTLTDSQTSHVISLSSVFEPSHVSSLPPVPLQSGLYNSLVISIYMKFFDDQKLLGSALIDLNQNLPLRTWLKIPSNGDEVLSIEIEIIKEEKIEILQINSDVSEIINQSKKCENLQNVREEHKNEEEMKELLRVYEIEDINSVGEKIEETKGSIAHYHSRKKIDKEEKEKTKLIGLQRLLQLNEEIKISKENEEIELIKKNNKTHNSHASNLDEENPEEELKQGLSKYQIDNPKKLEKLINESKKVILYYQKMKNLDEVEKLEKLVADYVKLKDIFNKINLKSMIMLDLNDIKNEKQLDFIEGLLSDISSYPDCTERFLTSILCYAYYKNYNFETAHDIHVRIRQIDHLKEFNNFIEFLNQNKQENLPRKLIKSFKESFENQNWKNLIKDIEKIFRDHLRPINIKEISRLISKSVHFSENLENKDIILLIGVTGSGKSTTTHFLCESKLERISENGVMHIKAIAVKTPLLKNTIISSQTQSETRYITMVPINIKETGKTIYLCDAPGLMDTKGAEIDIANTISIVEYAKRCRSVRPLILLSCKTEGDRFEGVKKLAHSLARLTPNFNKYSNSFTYAFTKYKKKDAANMHALIKDALELTDNQDGAFFHILNDMKNKTKNGTITINPLEDNPQDLIRIIMEREPILDPMNAFEHFITEDSRFYINNQMLVYSKDIEKALNSMSYEMIKYKLDDLKYIITQFNQFEPYYNNCVESVITNTNDAYNKAVAQFNSFLERHGSLDENSIKLYKEVYNALKISEEIRENHLKGETVKSAAMITNIVSQLSLAQLSLKCETTDSYILKAQLNNAKVLSQNFGEVAPHYQNIITDYKNLIKNLFNSAESHLNDNNFEIFASTLLQAKKYLGIVVDHFNLEALEEKHSNLISIFKSNLKSWKDKSISLLNKGCIEKYDIEILQRSISLIKSAIDAHSLNSLIPQEDIKNILQETLKFYQQYFEKANNNVIELINNEATHNISEIETKFDEFSLLMKIPDIEYLIVATYQETLNSLINKISHFKKEAREIVKAFLISPDSTNISFLRNCFSWLESGKWIEKFREGTYSNELSGIEKEIKNYMDKLLVEFDEIDLGYNFSANISKAYKIIKKLDPIQQLEEFIPSLRSYDNNIYVKFKERIEKVLKIMKREFNPELEDIAEELNDLERLKGIRNEYLKYKEEKKTKNCEELLEINRVDSIREIDSKISKREHFIEIFNKKLIKNVFDVDRIEDFYNYIEECKKIPELSKIIEPFYTNIIPMLSQFYNNHMNSSNECLNAISIHISNNIIWDINIIKQNSYQFSLSFKEIIQLNSKSQSFFNFLELLPHYDHCNSQLDSLCQKFDGKFNSCVEKNEIKLISLLLAVANDFSKFNNTFLEILNSYEKIQTSKLDQISQNIIQFIQSHDFDKLKQLIEKLDEIVLNQFMDTIKNKFYSEIDNLLDHLKERVLSISNSKLESAQLNSVITSFQDIISAKKLDLYDLLLDNKTKQIFINQEEEVKKIFHSKIEWILYTIKEAADFDKYYEAELKMKIIQEMKSSLLLLFEPKFAKTHINKIEKKLGGMPKRVIDTIRLCNIKDLKQCSLRIILQEFEDASKIFPRYKGASDKVKSIICKKFEYIKDTINKKYPAEKKEIIKDISSILDCLPDDIKKLGCCLINEIKKNYKAEKQFTREKIDLLAKDQNIKELCTIYHKLTKKKSESDALYASKKIKEVLLQIKDEISSCLSKGELEKAFKNAGVLEFEGKLNGIISSSDITLLEIQKSLKKFVENALSVLLNVEHKDKSDELIEAFKVHIVFMDFKVNFEKEMAISNVFEVNNIIESMVVGILNIYQNLYKSYLEFRPPKNAFKCNNILNKIREWDEFFRIYKEYMSNYQYYHCNIDYLKIQKLPRYSELVEELSNNLHQFSGYFLNMRIDLNQIRHQKLIEDCANEIQERLNQMQNYEDIKNHLNPQTLFENIKEGVLDSISKELNRIVNDASILINKVEITEKEFDDLKNYYSCLAVFEKNLKINGIDWRKTLSEIEDMMYCKTLKLKEKAEMETQVDEIAKPLIKMKKISNDFPLLKKELDKIMDDFFTTFGKKNKEMAVAMFGELNKHSSELGRYIIAEHRFFEWLVKKLWIDKTQMHGIDYAINHIEGTNLNKEELHNKYLEWDGKFKELRQIYSRIASNEGIGNSIAQIISKIEIKSKDHAITPSNKDFSVFRGFIPKLLAYIAMLWALLNIKIYKQDINARDREITMIIPHPIQILSIYRMIGIGYEENARPKNNWFKY